MAFYFVVKCPFCGNSMKYHSPSIFVADKRKRCVYCGKSFKIGNSIFKQIS